jgi:hypothetical protein
MIKYKTILLLLFCLVVEKLASQSYYVNQQDSTIYCTIIKDGPYGLRVKTKKKDWVVAADIKEYKLSPGGETLRRKKYNNGKEDKYLLLPADNKSGTYDYTDGHVYVLTDGTTTFYELITYGGVSQYGRDVMIDLFIENKEGFSSLDYGGQGASKKRREEIIKTLKQYLGSNAAVMAKLSDEENADLRRKGIEKMMEEYFNQKLPK